MSKDLKFSDAFKKIHCNSEPVISLHVNRLDRISNDIKSLDQVLVNAAIPFELYYELKTIECLIDNSQWSFYLIWDKKRLMYGAKVKKHSYPNDPNKEIPLIETKSRIRLSVENELPVFYKMIIEELEKDPLRNFVFVKSPNYTKTAEEFVFFQ